MARSVTGLFDDRAHVERLIATLRDAGFDPAQISIVSADGPAPDTATPAEHSTSSGHSVGAWIADHLRARGVSHEHAEKYQQSVIEGRQLVSVSVNTDSEDEEARSLMVDVGAEEISSAADGAMHPVYKSGGA